VILKVIFEKFTGLRYLTAPSAVLPIRNSSHSEEMAGITIREHLWVAFMDVIHFHVRSEGQIVKKAVYIAVGVQMDGIRDVLGMWGGENESAKYWLGILNSLENRGVEDILNACVDVLTGFTNAIEAVFPKKRKFSSA